MEKYIFDAANLATEAGRLSKKITTEVLKEASEVLSKAEIGNLISGSILDGEISKSDIHSNLDSKV